MDRLFQLFLYSDTMFKFNYKFYISSDVRGNQEPSMVFSHSENYKHLGNLARGRMAKSERIQEILGELNDVLDGKKEKCLFAGDDWCIVDFKRDKSIIVNGFDEFEPFEMDSLLILKLMKDWYEFLLKWENNETPGIIHPSKRGHS